MIKRTNLIRPGKLHLPSRTGVKSTGVAEIYGRKLVFELYVFLDFGQNFPPPSFCIVPTWRIARKYTHITYEALHSSVNTTAIWLSIIAPVMTIRKRRRRAFDWYVLLYLTKFKSFPLISTALLLGFPVLYDLWGRWREASKASTTGRKISSSKSIWGSKPEGQGIFNGCE